MANILASIGGDAMLDDYALVNYKFGFFFRFVWPEPHIDGARTPPTYGDGPEGSREPESEGTPCICIANTQSDLRTITIIVAHVVPQLNRINYGQIQ